LLFARLLKCSVIANAKVSWQLKKALKLIKSGKRIPNALGTIKTLAKATRAVPKKRRGFFSAVKKYYRFIRRKKLIKKTLKPKKGKGKKGKKVKKTGKPKAEGLKGKKKNVSKAKAKKGKGKKPKANKAIRAKGKVKSTKKKSGLARAAKLKGKSFLPQKTAVTKAKLKSLSIRMKRQIKICALFKGKFAKKACEKTRAIRSKLRSITRALHKKLSSVCQSTKTYCIHKGNKKYCRKSHKVCKVAKKLKKNLNKNRKMSSANKFGLAISKLLARFINKH
jgi:hypothetical protein